MAPGRTLRIIAALLISLAFHSPDHAHAQSGITILNPQVEYSFGQQINVQAGLIADFSVENVQFIFRPAGTNNSIVVLAQRDQDNRLEASYNLRPQDRIPPFTPIAYWFVVTASSGQQFQSEVFNFRYEDNRFQWQQLTESEVIQVHWYHGDAAFGQAALETALNASGHLNQYITLPEPSELDIYIYANSNDLQSALSLSGEDWIAGHAAPDRNVVLVTIAYGGVDQLLAMERRIPHEIAHVRLYQQIGEAYSALPVWFNEGIASLGELYPNPDYRVLLRVATQTASLIPFSGLCQSFSGAEDQISFSYAQSNSFLHYLYDTFGISGLQNLLNAYAQGDTCEDGVQRAFGRSLTSLEKDWQQQTSQAFQPVSSGETSLLAWLFLLLIMMVAPVSAILLSAGRVEGDSDG